MIPKKRAKKSNWMVLKLEDFDEKKEAEFTKAFWAKCTNEQKMDAVTELVETAWLMKGGKLEDLKMRRDVMVVKFDR